MSKLPVSRSLPYGSPARPQRSAIALASRVLLAGTFSAGLLLGLSACGGGGDSASTSSPTELSAQVSQGTITGFGSVYVNGIKMDDTSAPSLSYAPDGSEHAQALRLGQQVRVVHDGDHKASRVLVDAAVIGAVSTLDATAGTLVVAAQTVTVNTDSAVGPVTVFAGGYTALSDVLASDVVEVHGTPVYNSSAGRYDIQASRIEKRTDTALVRVTGKVSGLDTSAKTFVLNGLTVSYSAATLRPASVTLANDQNVIVWSSTYTSGNALTASGVRVVNTSADLPAATTARLSGLVSNASSTGFEVNGVKVSTSSTTTIKPTGASVVNAAYVAVTGVVQADGSVVATAVQVRQSDTVDDTARIRLSGLITSYVSDSSFVVRGVPVDASAISVATACPGVTLANDVAVSVVATAQAGTDVVKATALSCPVKAQVAHRDLRGTPSAVDSTAQTFTLTTARGDVQTVHWTDATAWGGTLTAASLSTATTVVVQGVLDSAGVLQARELRLPGTTDSDAYDSTSQTDTGRGWGRYDNRFRKQPH
ncbi:MAG: hypothetical protein RLZZ352_2894 [Pseudomonadota bacterium]|jgi:hypothetical protein